MTTPAITTPDGIDLAVEDFDVPQARADLVIVHGYAEHRGRYRPLVEELGARGFRCRTFDLRGHGESGGVAAHVGRFQDYIDDLGLVVEGIRKGEGDSRPLIIVAHSLGGLIALHFARSSPQSCNALAVSSPFLGPAFEVPSSKKVLAAIASKVAPTLPFDNPLNPRWLSHDAEIVAAYEADPLVHRTTTPRWYVEVSRAQEEIIAGAGAIRVPLLMLIGEDDRIADHRLALELYEKAGSEDKALRRYPAFKHEVFNEIGRDRVVADLITWLESHS